MNHGRSLSRILWTEVVVLDFFFDGRWAFRSEAWAGSTAVTNKGRIRKIEEKSKT